MIDVHPGDPRIEYLDSVMFSPSLKTGISISIKNNKNFIEPPTMGKGIGEQFTPTSLDN